MNDYEEEFFKIVLIGYYDMKFPTENMGYTASQIVGKEARAEELFRNDVMFHARVNNTLASLIATLKGGR